MPTTITRTHLILAGSALVAVAAFAILAWAGGATDLSQAANQQMKTEMHLEIDGTNSASPAIAHCDSRTQTVCALDEGSAFAVQVVGSIIPPGGFAGWQTLLNYGALLYMPMANGSLESRWDIEFKPVRSPASPTGKEGSVGHGDISAFFPDPATGLFPTSTQKAALLILKFNCAQNAGGDFSEVISLTDFNQSPSGATYVLPNGSTTNVPNVGSITIECTSPPPKLPHPGDTDGDGCSDEAENGSNENFGGKRNYLYFWDFFDVWTHPPGDPTGWERNGVINIFDMLAVASHFGPTVTLGTEEEMIAAALLNPDETTWNTAFDRGPMIGADPWDRAPPDGAISIPDDFKGVAQQFGHNCA